MSDVERDSRSPIKIPDQRRVIPTGQAKEEVHSLGGGHTTEERERQKFELIKDTSKLFKITTYFGYILLAALLIATGIEALSFHLDSYVLIALVIGVMGSNIARIIKQLQHVFEYN